MGDVKRFRRNSKERANLIADYEEHTINNTTDKGGAGKLFELLIRDYLNERLSSNDIRCRKQGKTDASKKINGKMTKIEIKTGCGVLCECYNEQKEVEKQILAKADLVIYTMEYNQCKAVEKQGRVMTRSQFINMLYGYNGEIKTWIRPNYHSGANKINLQEFKTSKRKTNYLTNALEQFPTVAEFFKA